MSHHSTTPEKGSEGIRMPRTLVTGGAGFVGSRVCLQLEEMGVPHLVIDDGSAGRPLPLATDVRSVCRADIRDLVAFQAAAEAFQPEAILHLAAIHHIPTCERDRSRAMEVNVIGTERLLELAERLGVGKFVIASSGAVYAWEDAPLSEDFTPLEPCDVYSLSKLTNERQVNLWSQRSGGVGLGARLFNVVGAGDPNGHLLPDLLGQMARVTDGTLVIRLGNLGPRRDYVHVLDAAEGFIRLLATPVNSGPGFEVFNLCSGKEWSVRSFVEAFLKEAGMSAVIESDPNRIRKVDRDRQLGAPEKTRDRLGWVARRDLADAFREVLDAAGWRVQGAGRIHA